MSACACVSACMSACMGVFVYGALRKDKSLLAYSEEMMTVIKTLTPKVARVSEASQQLISMHNSVSNVY